MPLPWPGIQNTGGNIAADVQAQITELLNRWADRVAALLGANRLPNPASPIYRPWNLVVVLDAEKVTALFGLLQGGMALVRWIDESSQLIPIQALTRDVETQLGFPVTTWVSFPRIALDVEHAEPSIEAAAVQHVADVERSARLGRLGDLSGLAHLEPFLRAFLGDHPEPSRNVFVMMRFRDSDQLREIHASVRAALRERNYDGIRADDRDYTGELWTNIEVCMTGCQYGLAVFEHIDDRAFNPNVSLELGYMLGRRKRCLILKEKRLPDLPTDVVHRLYKPFDMFNIADTVRAQVIRWIDVDLGGLATNV